MTRPLLSSLVGDAEIAVLFSPNAEIRGILAVEGALAGAQAQLGLIPQAAADRIEAVCGAASFDEPSLREGLLRDGVTAPDLVHQLRAAAGAKHAAAVHLGATSQDIIDTGLMLRLKALFDILDLRLTALVQLLETLAERDGAVAFMAQTRMQAALPFTAAAKIATWRDPLRQEAARLRVIRNEGLAVQLGGPIGDGSSFGDQAEALRAELARRLGLADAAPWQSARARVMEIGHALALLSGVLGKIGQDIALMAQNEVAAVKLSGGGGSSAMAHKQNPVAAEVLVALARFNAGLLGTLHQSMVHENERSGAAWTLEWMVLPQLAETTGAALGHALRLLHGLSFRDRLPKG